MMHRIWILIFFLISSCAHSPVHVMRSHLMMGHVPVNITIRTDKAHQTEAITATEAAYQRGEEIEKKISEYQPDSEVSCLNREAGKKSCPLSLETLMLLQEALVISDQVDHTFDLRFASQSPHGRTGKILLENQKGRLEKVDTRIGVGAIGKGFILDEMLKVIEEQGFKNALIVGGGDLRGIGGPWKIGIQKPYADPGKLSETLVIENRALATSGNYEQEGHIRDPRTGEKVIRTLSVSVLGPNLTWADALATAFYVLGEKESQRYLRLFQDFQMIWTDQEGSSRAYP